jgi:glycerol-3-phosphate acyltransferase PlsX
MGSIYARHRFGIDDPAVGLLSIGEEPGKGDTLRKEAYELLSRTPGIRFIGNIEGRDLMNKTADVIVTDGFTGNVALKALEGALKSVFSMLFTAFGSTPEYQAHADALLPAVLPVLAEMSPDTYGGAALLGVDGVCIISHGSSNSTAMVNAITLARDLVEAGLVDEIRAAIAQHA